MQKIKKILLVDDDRVTNLLHSRIVKQSGLIDRIEVTTDGIYALEFLDQQMRQGESQPEIILLDINMPRMNGFEFLEAYANLDFIDRQHQIVILLSTSVLSSDKRRAEQDPNVHKFVNKPMRMENLKSFVKEYQSHAGVA